MITMNIVDGQIPSHLAMPSPAAPRRAVGMPSAAATPTRRAAAAATQASPRALPGDLCLETTDLLMSRQHRQPPGRGTRTRDPRPSVFRNTGSNNQHTRSGHDKEVTPMTISVLDRVDAAAEQPSPG